MLLLVLSTFLMPLNLSHLLPIFQREKISLNDLHHLEPAYLRHIGLSSHEVLTIETALQAEAVADEEDALNRYFERIAIDILLIDTEGHDALVINGAKHLLLKKAIRYVSSKQ